MKIRTNRDQVYDLRTYVARFAEHRPHEAYGALVERLVEKGILDLEEVDEILPNPWGIEGVEGTECPKCKNPTWAGDRCFHPPCKAVRLKG